jgi:parvulin-like peptidyl-prolyl isomerase
MHKLKLRKLVLVLVFFIVYPVTIYHSYAEEKIVAIVNNEVITQNDLNSFINFMRVQLSKEYKGKELETKIQSMKLDLLNKLIEDRLILQEAKKNKIQIDENRIKARIEEIRSHYTSDMIFQADLKKQGLNQADVEMKIREQLLMYIIVEQKVHSKIVIKPEEVTNFYNENTKEFASPEEREIEAVTFKNLRDASSLYGALKKGKKIEDLVKEFSANLNNFKVTKGQELKKEVEQAIFKLGPGGISNPVKIDENYYIFKVNNITPSRQLSLPEVQDKIYAFLSEKKSQEELTKWLDELRAKSYIKITQD